jgi:hypothetical protein
MVSNSPNPSKEEQNKPELNDSIQQLIGKWKSMSLDEDSGDDFDPESGNIGAEYFASQELWTVR